jgi:hypothetical protein
MSTGIVVGGFYRSGTSVVRRVLDGHSRIACGQEAKLWMDLFGAYREDPLAHLRLFATLRTLGAGDDLLVTEFGGAYVRVLERLAAARGKARWADKAPENVLHLEHWARLLDGAFPFVHCVRDPRDVLASALEAGFRYTLPTDLDELITVHSTFLEAGLRREDEAPEHTFRLRYEDLVADPSGVVAGLMAFLGEEFEAAALDLSREENPGLEDPKITGREAIDDGSVGRHRELLSHDQQARIETACGPLAARLGYAW